MLLSAPGACLYRCCASLFISSKSNRKERRAGVCTWRRIAEQAARLWQQALPRSPLVIVVGERALAEHGGVGLVAARVGDGHGRVRAGVPRRPVVRHQLQALVPRAMVLGCGKTLGLLVFVHGPMSFSCS